MTKSDPSGGFVSPPTKVRTPKKRKKSNSLNDKPALDLPTWPPIAYKLCFVSNSTKPTNPVRPSARDRQKNVVASLCSMLTPSPAQWNYTHTVTVDRLLETPKRLKVRCVCSAQPSPPRQKFFLALAMTKVAAFWLKTSGKETLLWTSGH